MDFEESSGVPWFDGPTCAYLTYTVQMRQLLPFRGHGTRWGEGNWPPLGRALPTLPTRRPPRRAAAASTRAAACPAAARSSAASWSPSPRSACSPSVSASGQGPTTEYVVAADDLPAGRVIGPTDLETVAIDLPAAQAGAAYRDPSSLVGTITLAPIAEGELVQASAVGAPADDGVPTVAMSLPAAAALGGDLRPGDPSTST